MASSIEDPWSWQVHPRIFADSRGIADVRHTVSPKFWCELAGSNRWVTAERWWARTISPRRPLVCKTEPDCRPRITWSHSVLECPVQRPVRVHSVYVFTCCVCPSWHTLGTAGVRSLGARSQLTGRRRKSSRVQIHRKWHPQLGILGPAASGNETRSAARAGRITDRVTIVKWCIHVWF
jgi:hypothetical protein